MAAFFEKPHADVRRDFDNPLENIDNAELRSLFQEAPYAVDGQARTYRSIDLTKDGFIQVETNWYGLPVKIPFIYHP